MGATIDIIGKKGIKHTAVYESSSVRKFELMKEDYVRLVFSTEKKFAVSLGDYITLEEWGTFYITKPQKPTYNLTTGGYDYDLQFDAPHYRWNNKLYKFEPNTNRNEASWTLTDNLQNHMAVFLRNLAHHGWNYTVDAASYQLEAASRYIYIQFDNCYLLDALTKIAEAFDVEWWITDNIIHFGKAESGTVVDFETGVNVEEMGVENSNKEYFTRLYAFGSTRNIPSDYRKNDEQLLLNGVVQKRVMLPSDTPFVDIEEGLTDEEIVEGIVMFDDVYPRLDNSITDLRSDEREVEKTDTVEAGDGESSDESETETVTIYRFKDSSLTFSKDYILPGEQLQVQFQSGKLNGMIFDLAFNPDDKQENTEDGQWFEIVRNDTYGVMLPNDILKPEKTNKFVLLGWDVTKIESGMGLITKAEKEVLERVKEYVKDLQTDSNTYPCTMMSDYMFGLNRSGKQDGTFSKVGTFPLGQRIRLNNDNFFASGSRVSRVVGFEYKLDLPYDGAIIYVGESATYSSKQAQEAKINEAVDAINYRGGEYTSSGGGGSSVYIITSNDTTMPTDANVYSALRSDKQFARKDKNDNISSLWTFNNGHGARRGIQTHDYSQNGANEDNLFGHGFELITKTDANGNRKSKLEVDELFVRIKAFFASLEIREISYLGGNYAFSSAGSKIYHVEWLDGLGNILPRVAANISSIATFRCYLYSDDGTTATMNKWALNDQIMCQTFNIDEGVHENVSNKYYWRRCTGIGKGVIADSDDETQYQYVDISMSDCASNSDYPEDEDTIVQFGNWTDEKRQGLIYLKVEGDDAPAIIEYSGVGSNGKHFILPDPNLMLSPKRNIIYGEFHSVVDSSDDNVGGGDTIDDQLRALIDALNDIKNQADQKFDIWFGSGIPLPNADNSSGANYPAIDWTTDELKALHSQDIFYDTNKEPASTGGRAWRWMAYELNGEVHYRWEDITDADTLAALEQISDVASDGILTGGAEKTKVFIDWQKAVQEYWEFKERAADYEIATEWTEYHNAFVTLGTLLNGGSTLTKNQDGSWKTPAWLEDLWSETIIPSPEDYRNAWKGYYGALVALSQEITRVAKELADAAQQTADEAKNLIADIASDNKLDPSEKQTIKREFIAAYHEMNDTDEAGYKSGILDRASYNDGSVITYYIDYLYLVAPYIESFNNIGKFLNGGNAWYKPALANFNDSTLPEWLQEANMGNTESIDGSEFVNLWQKFYSLRTAVLTALSKRAQETGEKAQQDIDTIASDGILSKLEKKEVRKEFEEIIKSYTRNTDAASNVGVSSSSYTMCYARLGQYMNGCTNPNNTSTWTAWNVGEIPMWLCNSGEKNYVDGKGMGYDTEIVPETYRKYWVEYYEAERNLLNSISELTKDTADEAIQELSDLASDGILTEFEKIIVLRDWDAITTEKTDLLAKAANAHVSSINYEFAYNVLGNYLNDPSQQHPKEMAFSGTPTALTTSGNTNIDANSFKAYWSNFYNERTKLLSAISTSKVSYFVSVNVPTPPYHVGDIWMRLANTSDTKGKVYVCVVDNETSTGRLADWADMSEITRDPFVLLAKVANEAWEFMGGYIRERGYISLFVARTAPTGTKGDIFYNAATNALYQYADDGWEQISRDSLLNLGASLYYIIGIHTYRVYKTTVSYANQYDMCVRNISFTDPLSGQTVDGNLNILAYSDGNWLTLQESTRAMIENYADQLNSYMFGSENGYIKASGMVTKTNISELFAQVNDPNSGDIITKAYLQVYTQDFVDENGVRNIVSGVRISADKIDFEGKTFTIGAEHISLNGSDEISLALNDIKTGLSNTGINIQEGKITLNAATTTINGNLNLYDSYNNGLTVYDENNISRVNIQSDPIGSISQMANDTYNYQSCSSSTSTTSYNNTATTSSIGTIAVNKTIEVDNISLRIYGNGSYPSTYSGSLKIELLNGSTVVATKTVTITRKDNYGFYKASSGIRFTAKTSGTYYVRYTVSGISGTATSPATLFVNAGIQTSDVVQTFIGADGFYSHPGANKLFWIDENELQFRMGFGGLKLSMPSEQAFKGRLETIATVYGSNPNYKPVWMPFHNIMPMFEPAIAASTETVVNTGDTGKYVYKIDPFNDCGICYVNGGIGMDSSGNFQDGWVLLPSSSQTYNGSNVKLPVGYTVTVINGTSKNLYVSGNVSQRHACKIIDANRNENYYCKLNSTQSRDTYIYVGSYADGSITGNVDFWIAMHDTQ